MVWLGVQPIQRLPSFSEREKACLKAGTNENFSFSATFDLWQCMSNNFSVSEQKRPAQKIIIHSYIVCVKYVFINKEE